MTKAKSPSFPLTEKQVNDMATAMLIACNSYLEDPNQYHTDQLNDELWAGLQYAVLPEATLRKLERYEICTQSYPCPEVKWLWLQAEVFVLGASFDHYESADHHSDSFAEFILLESPSDLNDLLSVTLPFLERSITSITPGHEVTLARAILARIRKENEDGLYGKLIDV